jgi:Protein of unknown function (DUF2927)
MKFAIGISIVGMFFFTIACKTNDETTPDPNVVVTVPGVTNTTTKPTTTVTNQEVYNEFVRLALKSTDGKQSATIRKWNPSFAQVKIFWDNGSDATLLKNLDKIIADINTLSKSNKFVRTSVAAEAQITINKDYSNAHDLKYPQFKVSNPNMSGETYTIWGASGIQKAVVWLSPTSISSLITGIMRHELLHGLGLGHTENTKSIMVAVMNGANYDFTTFSTLDKSVVSILQDPRVMHGNQESNVSAVIKEYATKASSMRKTNEEMTVSPIGETHICHFIEEKTYSKASVSEK